MRGLIQLAWLIAGVTGAISNIDTQADNMVVDFGTVALFCVHFQSRLE